MTNTKPMPSFHFRRHLLKFSLNILILRLKTLLILYPRIETPYPVLPCCQPNTQFVFRLFGATTKRPTEETEISTTAETEIRTTSKIFSLLPVSRSPHTNNQYESRIFAMNFCLFTLWVNIGKIKLLNYGQNT